MSHAHAPNDEREAYEALHQSEQRFRSLYESVQAGVIVQTPDGTITHANKIACDILGMAAGAILSKNSLDAAWQMVTEDGRPVPGEEHPSMIALRDGKPVRNAIRGLFAGDPDRLRWLLINAEPLRDPASGRVAEFIITFTDITQLKQAEEALRQSEERMALAIAASKLGVYDWNMLTDEFSWTPRLLEMFGLEPGATPPGFKNWAEHVNPEDLPGLLANMQECLAERRPNHQR